MNHPSCLDDERLREVLKRCSPATYYAACKFRHAHDATQIPAIVVGVIERFVEREQRARLQGEVADLRLRDDLGLDSLTLMEVVMLAEEVLPVSVSNEELSHLRTIGDVQRFMMARLRETPPSPPPALIPAPGTPLPN